MRNLSTAARAAILTIGLLASAVAPVRAAAINCTQLATGMQLCIPKYNTDYSDWARATINAFSAVNSSVTANSTGAITTAQWLNVNRISGLSTPTAGVGLWISSQVTVGSSVTINNLLSISTIQALGQFTIASTTGAAQNIVYISSQNSVALWKINGAGNVVSGSSLTAGAFYGDGANLVNLNATTLLTGTVPSARVSGSYTGITGVGTVTAGTWTGSVVGAQYGGTGTNLVTSPPVAGRLFVTDGLGGTALPQLANTATPGSVLQSAGESNQVQWTSAVTLTSATLGSALIKSASPTLVFEDTDDIDARINVNGGSFNITNEAGTALIKVNTSNGNVGINNQTPATKLSLSSGTLAIDGTAGAIRIGGLDTQLADSIIQMLIQGGGNINNSAAGLGLVFDGTLNQQAYAGMRVKSGAIAGISGIAAPVAQLYNVGSNSLEIYNSGNAPLVFGTNNTSRLEISGAGAITTTSSVSASGAILSLSSITASAFFGDASHMSNIGETNTYLSSKTFGADFVIKNASTGTVFYVSTNGFVGAPFQPRMKVVTSGQNITPSATQSVFWDVSSAQYNVGNLMVAASSDTFTIPYGASGSYHSCGHVQIPNIAQAVVTCFIQVNGTNKDTWQTGFEASAYKDCGGCTDLELNGGDTVRFRINQNDGSARTICGVGNGPDCTFSIRKN